MQKPSHGFALAGRRSAWTRLLGEVVGPHYVAVWKEVQDEWRISSRSSVSQGSAGSDRILPVSGLSLHPPPVEAQDHSSPPTGSGLQNFKDYSTLWLHYRPAAGRVRLCDQVSRARRPGAPREPGPRTEEENTGGGGASGYARQDRARTAAPQSRR